MDGVERGLEPAVRHLKAQELRSDGHRDIQSFYVELRVIAFAVIVPFITGN